jgi:hypothetical protein
MSAPPKSLKLPTDTDELLAFVLANYFDGSPLRLATAAGLSRAYINKWPPESRIIMLEHILTALETELAAAKARASTLYDAKWAMKTLIRDHRHESEAKIRKDLGQ